MSARLSDPSAARREVSGASTPEPVMFIPPYPAGTIKLLAKHGHSVTVRRMRCGSLRYRIDGGRELQAIQMDRF